MTRTETTKSNDRVAPVLRVEEVAKRFGGVTALDDVSLEIFSGEVVGLVGDNGAGKSTLIKVVSGVHSQTEGKLYLDGREVSFSSPSEARQLGIETVYQDLALVDSLDVQANFFLGRELTKGGLLRPFKVMRLDAMRALARDGVEGLHIRIPGLASDEMGRMSGGQRQAVAIARAAYWGKKLMLLDEPTAALGVRESREVNKLISHMAGTGLPMLVISHNLEHVWQVCDRIIVLRQGKKAADLVKDQTTPEEVVRYITGAGVAGVS